MKRSEPLKKTDPELVYEKSVLDSVSKKRIRIWFMKRSEPFKKTDPELVYEKSVLDSVSKKRIRIWSDPVTLNTDPITMGTAG